MTDTQMLILALPSVLSIVVAPLEFSSIIPA
jgi:hypothetical protein